MPNAAPVTIEMMVPFTNEDLRIHGGELLFGEWLPQGRDQPLFYEADSCAVSLWFDRDCLTVQFGTQTWANMAVSRIHVTACASVFDDN